MVATISTRGSSEGLLGVLVLALLWAVLAKKTTLAALLLGFGVHFKIYPFIYAPAIVWWMDDERSGSSRSKKNAKKDIIRERSFYEGVLGFVTPARLQLAILSLATFMGLNILMFAMYDLSTLSTPYPQMIFGICSNTR